MIAAMPPGIASQLMVARVAHLHGGGESAEDMPADCKGCGHCCGRVLVTTAADNRRVVRYANRHHLEPVDGNLAGVTGMEQACGWLDPKTRECRIYPARPLICRCWGNPHDGPLFDTKPGQPCGLRLDMADLMVRVRDQLGYYDTWKSEWSEA